MSHCITADSNFRQIKGEITWTIREFSERMKATVVDQKVTSPTFTIPDPAKAYAASTASANNDEKGYSFRLWAYLKGTYKDPKFFGLFIQSHNEETILLKCSLFFLDSHGSKVNSFTSTGYFNKGLAWGYPSFCKQHFLSNRRAFGRLINSNTLTIGCEIDIMVNRDITGKEQNRIPESPTKLGDQLYSRMKNNIMTDLTLICGPKYFQCHKLVLAAQSTVFHNMFRHSEDDKKELIIKDMKPEVLKKVLEFVYLDKVEIGDDAKDLFLAGDKYNIVGLKLASEHALVRSLTVSNVAETFMLLDMHGCHPDHKRAAFRFAAQNLSEVIKTEAWAMVVDMNQTVINDLLQLVAESHE